MRAGPVLQVNANTELLDVKGRTALQHAKADGHTTIAELIRQHTAPLQPAATSPSDAVLPLTWPCRRRRAERHRRLVRELAGVLRLGIVKENRNKENRKPTFARNRDSVVALHAMKSSPWWAASYYCHATE